MSSPDYESALDALADAQAENARLREVLRKLCLEVENTERLLRAAREEGEAVTPWDIRSITKAASEARKALGPLPGDTTGGEG